MLPRPPPPSRYIHFRLSAWRRPGTGTILIRYPLRHVVIAYSWLVPIFRYTVRDRRANCTIKVMSQRARRFRQYVSYYYLSCIFYAKMPLRRPKNGPLSGFSVSSGISGCVSQLKDSQA